MAGPPLRGFAARRAVSLRLTGLPEPPLRPLARQLKNSQPAAPPPRSGAMNVARSFKAGSATPGGSRRVATIDSSRSRRLCLMAGGWAFPAALPHGESLLNRVNRKPFFRVAHQILSQFLQMPLTQDLKRSRIQFNIEGITMTGSPLKSRIQDALAGAQALPEPASISSIPFR